MDRSIILSTLKTAKTEMSRKYGLSALALFGSYSRGEQNSESDIDLLVDFSNINSNDFFPACSLYKIFLKTKRLMLLQKMLSGQNI